MQTFCQHVNWSKLLGFAICSEALTPEWAELSAMTQLCIHESSNHINLVPENYVNLTPSIKETLIH